MTRLAENHIKRNLMLPGRAASAEAVYVQTNAQYYINGKKAKKFTARYARSITF